MLILSPLWVRRILSAIVLLMSKITNLDLRILAGIRLGELGTEFSGEFVADVDTESSPFANVLCEKNSDISDSTPLPRISPFSNGTSALAAQNRCGLCGTEFVT